MKTSRTRHWRRNLTGYLFILPNLLGFLLFTSLPVVASLLLAFTHWDIISEPVYSNSTLWRPSVLPFLSMTREVEPVVP